MDNSKLTIVYDNQLHDRNLKSGWGFSCLVEHRGKTVLFDTGDKADKLSFNLKALRIDPLDIEALVLSHNHWDHTGGLSSVLGKNKDATIYFGQSYPASFRERIRTHGVNFMQVDKLQPINENIFVGPEMGVIGIKEIALTLQTDKGLVIITGCAHPGILNIIQTIKEGLARDVYMVLGGFHLGMSLGLKSIVQGFQEQGVKKVGPCHCTGQRGINLFRKEYKENLMPIGSGLVIEI